MPRRKLHQHHLAEYVGFLRQHGFKYLLRGTIDAAHDGHAVEDPLAVVDEQAAHQPGGQRANDDEDEHRNDEADTRKRQMDKPDARHIETQVVFRIVGLRQ
jgi:hypothetical protein